MKFGVREICDVTLKAKAAQKIGNKIFYKDEPVIYFDTLKTSTLESASTTVYAQGGRGNARLIAWEGERTVTFTMEDALISPVGLMILTGAGLIEATSGKTIKQHVVETIDKSDTARTVQTGTDGSNNPIYSYGRLKGVTYDKKYSEGSGWAKHIKYYYKYRADPTEDWPEITSRTDEDIKTVGGRIYQEITDLVPTWNSATHQLIAIEDYNALPPAENHPNLSSNPQVVKEDGVDHLIRCQDSKKNDVLYYPSLHGGYRADVTGLEFLIKLTKKPYMKLNCLTTNPVPDDASSQDIRVMFVKDGEIISEPYCVLPEFLEGTDSNHDNQTVYGIKIRTNGSFNLPKDTAANVYDAAEIKYGNKKQQNGTWAIDTENTLLTGVDVDSDDSERTDDLTITGAIQDGNKTVQGPTSRLIDVHRYSSSSTDFDKIYSQYDSVIVDYYTEVASEAFQADITPDQFGGNFYLEASTLFRTQNGIDMPAEIIIPNCKIQSNFTFTMASSGDPSTFTFTMDAFPDYTKWDKSRKVLAAIQVFTGGNTTANLHRHSTPASANAATYAVDMQHI